MSRKITLSNTYNVLAWSLVCSIFLTACNQVSTSSVCNDISSVDTFVGHIVVKQIETQYSADKMDAFGDAPLAHYFNERMLACGDLFSDNQRIEIYWSLFWTLSIENGSMHTFLAEISTADKIKLSKKLNLYLESTVRKPNVYNERKALAAIQLISEDLNLPNPRDHHRKKH